MDCTKYFESGWKSIERSWVGRYSSANTRRSGSANAVDVYSMRGVCTTRPQPQVALTRTGQRDAKSRTTSHAAPVIRIRPRATSVGDIRANPLGIDRETPEPNPGTGTGRRAEPASAAASAGMIATAANPKTAQATARIPMPTRIDTGASCAHSAAGERGIARNVIPKAL